MTTMKRKAYLDLDGVLVDFIRGAINTHGWEHLPYGEIGWDVWKMMGLTDKQFWEPLGYTFWANLEWMPDGRQLFAAVEKVFGREQITLVTSPCLTPGCMEGKREWVKRHLPDFARRLCFLNDKSAIASDSALLIDDSDHNLDAYSKAGGPFLPIPRPWNRHGKKWCNPDGTLRDVTFQNLAVMLSEWHQHGFMFHEFTEEPRNF